MRAFLAVLLFLVAVAGMFAFLILQPSPDPSFGFPMVLIGIAGIIAFSWAGLFQKSIISYAIFSTIIQSAYFILDTGSAVLVGKPLWFAVLQALNFTIAGGLFMLVFVLFYKTLKREDLAGYSGLYEKNKFLVFSMSLACLSLGGMAGFNIFVGEFLLYSFLFAVHPALAISAIFAGLVCFLFYFRICYTLMVRKNEETIPLPLPARFAAAMMGGLVVALGVIPHALLLILEAFT